MQPYFYIYTTALEKVVEVHHKTPADDLTESDNIVLNNPT